MPAEKLSMKPLSRPPSNPMVTVIIPVEPTGGVSLALDSILSSGYPASKLQVLVERGLNPPAQRNRAARKARGTFILFMDSDSQAKPGLVRRLLDCFDSGEVAAAGGPDLPLLPQTFDQQC